MPVKRSLYQNLIWRGAYYLSVFLLNIAIARHFEAAISGRLFYICSVYSVVVMLTGLSLESGLTFFSSKNILTPGKLFNLSVIWSLFTGVACLLLAYLFFPGTILGIGQGMLILSSVCFVTGNLLTTYITGLFYSKGDFKWPNLAGTLINLLLILILIMPALVINPISSLGSLGYFHWYFISFLLTGIVLAFIYYFRYRPALFSSGLLSVYEMALCVFAVDEGYFDDVAVNQVVPFGVELIDYVRNYHADFMKGLTQDPSFDDKIAAPFQEIVAKFKDTQTW